jgi:alkylation response protein AidB-like acyl-CoA dehydrogenase
VDAAGVRARAVEIADQVLFPSALAVDRADRVPTAHLDLLAHEGFYGVAAPADAGGLGSDDMSLAGYLVETFASGCLATTFVWIQHHGPVLASAFSEEPGITERWLGPLARGERRGGIARAGLRPGPPMMRVRPVDGGYLLDGVTPWVTGWDLVDTLHVAARDPADVVHYLLVDAAGSASMTAELLHLVAAQASRTVNLTFTEHFVPADRLTGTEPYDEFLRNDASGSALNGFLALGVANRCCRLLGPSTLDDELVACRSALLAADATTTPAARAAASHLALRAAAALAIQIGSRSVLRGDHPERLQREAAFLLVFGTRPAIRDALLSRIFLDRHML